MGLKSFSRSIVSTLRLARKSNRQEFLLYMKLVFLGMALVGAIGFIVQFLALLFIT